MGLNFAFAIFMIAGMLMVPESPRFLVEKGEYEDAKRSLAKSNKVTIEDPSIVAEMDTIMANVETERLAGNASWGELFSNKGAILPRVIMGIMIQSLQQLTGNNYFFYYGTTIFNAVGMKDSFQTSIVLGIVNLCIHFRGLIHC